MKFSYTVQALFTAMLVQFMHAVRYSFKATIHSDYSVYQLNIYIVQNNPIHIPHIEPVFWKAGWVWKTDKIISLWRFASLAPQNCDVKIHVHLYVTSKGIFSSSLHNLKINVCVIFRQI